MSYKVSYEAPRDMKEGEIVIFLQMLAKASPHA